MFKEKASGSVFANALEWTLATLSENYWSQFKVNGQQFLSIFFLLYISHSHFLLRYLIIINYFNQIEVYARAGTDEMLHHSKSQRRGGEEKKEDIEDRRNGSEKIRLQSKELGVRGPESDSSEDTSSVEAVSALRTTHISGMEVRQTVDPFLRKESVSAKI